MKFPVAVAATFCVVLFTSCGSSGGSSSVIPPVQAQASYSNASLSGTYALSLVSTNSPNSLFAGGGSGPFTAIGTIQFNGSGSLTGSITGYSQSNSCPVSLAGTYSVQSTGLGTASFTVTTSSGNCVNVTMPLNLAVAQQGTSVLFTYGGSAATNPVISGTAIKQ